MKEHENWKGEGVVTKGRKTEGRENYEIIKTYRNIAHNQLKQPTINYN